MKINAALSIKIWEIRTQIVFWYFWHFIDRKFHRKSNGNSFHLFDFASRSTSVEPLIDNVHACLFQKLSVDGIFYIYIFVIFILYKIVWSTIPDTLNHIVDSSNLACYNVICTHLRIKSSTPMTYIAFVCRFTVRLVSHADAVKSQSKIPVKTIDSTMRSLSRYLLYRPRRNWSHIVSNSMLRGSILKQNIFIKQITRFYSSIKSDLICRMSCEYSWILFFSIYHIQLFHHANKNGKMRRKKNGKK